MNILIIDDNPSFLESTSQILEQNGYTPFSVLSGSDAIKILQKQSLDIALIDVNLPDYEGFDLLQDLKIIDPQLGTVIITGYSSLDVAISSINIGADGYLSKPIDVEELLDVLKKIGISRNNLQLQKRIAENEKRLTALHASTIELSQVQSMDDIYNVAFKTITEILGYPIAGIAVSNDNGYEYIRISEFLPEKFLLSKGEGLTGQVFESGESLLIGDITKTPNYVPFAGSLNLKSELIVPIKFYNSVFAVINVENPSENAFDQSDKNILELLADYIASSVIRLWRLRELEELVKERTQDLQMSNERLKQLDVMKTNFISTATHELRTPLQSIKGYTELILSGMVGPVNDELKEPLKIIFRNTKRLQNLTDDLLDQQRLESGRFNITKTTFVLADLLDEIKTESIPIFAQSNAELEIIINSNIDSISADRIRLAQVLVNLLNNAVRYSNGNNKVTLVVEKTAEILVFSIIDNGIGISDEDLDRLFTPFPNIVTHRVTGGTGLGLSICKGIVELHGGTIYAHSDGKDKGSTFTFTIPE